jgi:AcrR family transcriptional regulator
MEKSMSKKPTSQKLARKDWIDAALRALASGGVEGVRVEPLAQALGVTKGSFYWHFADRGALLGAVLEAWAARATEQVIDTVERTGPHARERVRALMTIVFSADGRLENQVRSWASLDPRAAAALEEIDRKRLGYVVRLLETGGFDPEEAAVRARFAYHAMVGRFAQSAPGKAEPMAPEHIERMCAMLLRKPATVNRG